MADSRPTPSAHDPAAPQSKPFCLNGPRPKVPLSPKVMGEPGRASAIRAIASKWLNKTVLHYAFFGHGKYAVPKEQADAVRQAFATWKAVGIGLEFREVTDLADAEVRIGFSLAMGESQSSVGRDVLNVPLTEPTTLYGWDLTTKYGRGTALHELGHVFGMEHEHQSPFAGIKWNEQAVYDSLGKPPNSWSRQVTFHNILEKLDPQQVEGSTWDPDSIMEYEFEKGLIVEPAKYQDGLVPPGVLSKADKDWVVTWYPGEGTAAPTTEIKAFHSISAELKAGEQRDFIFHPTQSRSYTITTHGATDTLLGLFEQIDGEPRFVAGDDDSGEERIASIKQKLFKGRTYIVRLRLFHPGQTGTTALLVS